jgi:hypothetical protein
MSQKCGRSPVSTEDRLRQRREQRRKSDLARLYGPDADYGRMFAAQNGACKLCGKQPWAGRVLAVDHCHETGKVRGLLCAGCNTGLGKLGGTTESLMRALQYVARSGNPRWEARQRAEAAIAANPHWSSRKIAREIGVDHKTVCAARGADRAV